MDGFLHRQVVHVDLCVGCTRYQYPVPGVREELCAKDKKTQEDGNTSDKYRHNVSQRILFKDHIVV